MTFSKNVDIAQLPQGIFHLINLHALRESAQHALTNCSMSMQFDTRLEFWSYCLNRIPQLLTDEEGFIAELGLYKRESINFFAKSCP